MTRFAGCLFACLFVFSSTSGIAQDGGQVFQGIVGGILNEIQRQEQIKEQQRLQQQQYYQQQQAEQELHRQLIPYWEACGGGDVESCDSAAQFPLNSESRIQLDRMRRDAVLKKAFQDNWRRCFYDQNTLACRSALDYPQLNDTDRQQILSKQQQIREDEERRQQAKRDEEERRRQQIALELAQRQAEIEQQRRVAHEKDLNAAREPCVKRQEAACVRGLTIAANDQEKAEFIYLLDVAQSPLGIPLLKPLKDIPQSTFVMGGVAAVLAILLILLYVKRYPSMRFASPAQFADSLKRFFKSLQPDPDNARRSTAPAMMAEPQPMLSTFNLQMDASKASSPPAPAVTAPLQPATSAVPPANWIVPEKALLIQRIGTAGVALSFLWWLIFYVEVMRQTGGTAKDFNQIFPCLFYTTGVCTIVKGVASFAGYWPYEPILLWLSAALAGLGYLNSGNKITTASNTSSPANAKN